MGRANAGDVNELVTTLRPTPQGRAFSVLSPGLIRLLARGRAVTPAQVAAEAGVELDRVLEAFRDLPDAELDEEGNLIGLGLTLRRTPHRFEIDGRELFTWCALDTLMYPPLIGAVARVESPCRATGEPIRVEVGPDGVRRVDPPSAVVSIVVPEEPRNIRASFCNEVHFFLSRDIAGDWLEEHSHASVVSVVEAFDLGRQLNEATFGDGCENEATGT